MKTAFLQTPGQGSEGIGCSTGNTAPSPSHSLSSTTHLCGDESVSCNSSKAGEAFPAAQRAEPLESCQEASTYAERNVLPFGGARSWSCSEGTLGHATGAALLGPQDRSGSGKRVRRCSADSSELLRHQNRRVQIHEPQKRKWQAVKKEPVKLDDLLDPDSSLLEASKLWEEDNIARRVENNPTLKTELVHAPVGPLQRSQSMKSPMSRKGSAARNRTSRYIGVGSSNRKNQWQARILVHGKVTHLGYYRSEEEAAIIYDRVAVSLNGAEATTNFPAAEYMQGGGNEFLGLGREDLQRALGVKPMDKSSRFRGVSRKKGKWEAKVMVNRKWAYRALFDSEDEAAHAYDAAVRRLKPREASSFVNFGMSECIPDSSIRHVPASRSLSQKLRPKSAKKVLKRQPHSFSDILSLDDTHIPPAYVDLDAPSTPRRQPSVQAPVSPISGNTRATVASNLVTSSLYGDLSSSTSFSTEGLPVGMQSVTNSPISKRCNSLGQLSTTLPPSCALNLPDPNSIGVPPPDNLPFPELVKTPFSSAAGPESLLQSCPSGSLLPSRSSGAPSQPNSMRPLSQASSLHSSLTLPEIPMPILEPTSVLSPENPNLGIESYFASTPLSQQLGQTLAQSQQMHRQELHHESSPPRSTQNPFQEASKQSPLLPVTASPLKHTSSGSFPPPLPPKPGSLKTLKSMPESEFLEAAQQTLAQPFGRSANLSPMHRASSDGLLRHQNSLADKDPPSNGIQMGLTGSHPGDMFGMQSQPDRLTHQMSSSSCNDLKQCLLGRSMRAGPGPSVHFQVAGEVIPQPHVGGHQGIGCNLSEDLPPLEPHLGGPTLQDLSPGQLSFLSDLETIKREKHGGLHRSMSALPSLPFLMEEGASNPLHNMRQGSNLDALAPSVCNLNNGGAEGEVIDDNATDLLNGLLRESVVPTDSQGVQIGGEYLHAFDPLDLVGDTYVPGRN